MPGSRIYNPAVGGAAGVGEEAIEITIAAFNFNDTSPKVMFNLPAGTKIVSTQIILSASFNDAAATLEVGDAGDDNRYMIASENVPSETGEYEANRYYVLPANTDILLKIVPGTSTQGSGQVLMEYKQP